mmetsp:Transcript_27707/g.85669  ORF Transcript_27707/g.85669 Transcript_27707/m.85669 type:complete len:238 (-) Transcript_27707:356-1069(-)
MLALRRGAVALGGRAAALKRAARSVFIQVEKTPNPFSLKFLPSQPVKLGAETTSGFHFTKGEPEALRSPLARKLFSIDNVTGIFVASDFVTVSKDEEGAWATIKPHVFSHIMDFFAEGSDAIASGDAVASDTEILDTDSEVVAMIKELIEVRIRPAVQEDGGDIFFRGFDDATGIVSVELAGSCVGCPSSSVTLNNGVENMLMHYVEEVKGIENVTPEEEADEFKLSFAPQDSHLSI